MCRTLHADLRILRVLSRCPLRDALFAETRRYYSASYCLDFDCYYYNSDLFYVTIPSGYFRSH